MYVISLVLSGVTLPIFEAYTDGSDSKYTAIEHLIYTICHQSVT